MSRLYDPQHRSFQDEFGTRAMADRIEELACRTEFDDDSRGFIEAMDMFFLSTVDARGRPTVSYKGGDPGFVRVVDEKTLVFPSYDGNGMFTDVTDEASAIEAVGLKPRLVAAGAANLKVTWPEDMKLAELILQTRGNAA